MTHTEYANSLREIADFFEAHPECPLPHDAAVFDIYNVATKKELKPWIDALGSFRKEVDDSFFRVTKQFGSITLKIYLTRQQACKKVVLGKKKIVEQVPTGYREVEREVDDVRWDCEPLLAEL